MYIYRAYRANPSCEVKQYLVKAKSACFFYTLARLGHQGRQRRVHPNPFRSAFILHTGDLRSL